MFKTLRELNKELRVLFLVLGGLVALLKITEKKNIIREEDDDGYQTKEFDDIW